MYNKLFFLIFLLVCCSVFTTCVSKEMEVSTTTITGITQNSATAGGQIIDLGKGANQHGHCYGKTSGVNITGLKTELGAPKGLGSFTSEMVNLEAGTKYYVAAYLSDGEKTVYGTEISFSTTAASVPTNITTTAISNITQTSATGGGNINSDGGAPVTERGVCWTTSQNPTTANNKTTDGTGTGSFISNLTNLQPGTTYYVKAYATNSSGTAYGNELSFTTICTAPSATTNAATSLTNTTVTLNGTVNANGCSTTVTFDYGLTSSYGSTLTAVQSPVSGTTLTSVSVGITGLASGQTYHYRVKAVSTGGTPYGGDILFTTTVNDKDGNVYNTVTIGTQVWMKENLKTMKYNDGTSIPNVTVDATWAALTTPAYCWYNNNAAYKPTYGALYNWYTVNTGKLCPAGWHVPTEAEWTTLTDYLGGASVAGGKLKESGTAHWSSPNTGATNESSFTALPGGWRNFNGTFYEITNFGIWLSSTEFSATTITCQYMGYYYIFVDKNYPPKSDGHSVRCVRD